ncbi:MAG: hypothetical protein ACN6PH_17855 [Pseudomonas sp.]|uniref:hypothetical protein n=1 Tax=Stutzerimonas nitrititolerans TaxID=2482751 RepID=UPI0011C46525|nr:hypothetical protein [Stutzerimonas nitrititolerans]
MEPLFLTGKRTLLYPQTARRVELLDNAIFEKIQKWRMFPARWELETEDFHGKKISYRGIKYTGSPEMVFWCYFQPFFDHEIPKVLAEIEKECSNKNLPPEEFLKEAADLLKVMVSRLWKEIAKTHQILKGNGFPKVEDLRDMSGTISAAKEKIDAEVAALLLRGTPALHENNPSPEDILEIKPNVMGIGINFNAFVRWAIRKWKGI